MLLATPLIVICKFQLVSLAKKKSPLLSRWVKSLTRPRILTKGMYYCNLLCHSSTSTRSCTSSVCSMLPLQQAYLWIRQHLSSCLSIFSLSIHFPNPLRLHLQLGHMRKNCNASITPGIAVVLEVFKRDPLRKILLLFMAD